MHGDPVRPAQREHGVSRLEGFSDAVFGFALTLLVVQLEAPRTSEALRLLVRGSFPFAITFAMVCYIWWEHNKFFRQYGMQDAWTAALNSMLLFVVLFYVYPLEISDHGAGGTTGRPAGRRLEDGRFVMLVYSTGIVLIFGVFVLLYLHAWSNAAAARLSTPAQETTLRYKVRAHLISAGLGVASIALATGGAGATHVGAGRDLRADGAAARLEWLPGGNGAPASRPRVGAGSGGR